MGDRSDLALQVLPATAAVSRLGRMTDALAEHFRVLEYVSLAPDGATLGAPAQLALDIDPKQLPAGRSIAAVRVVAVDIKGNASTLLTAAKGNTLEVPVSRLELLVVLVPKPGVELLGSPALVLRGASQLLLDPQCPTWINPAASRVAALAKDPAKFSIDDTGVIHLEPPLAVTDIDELAQLRHADETLARGGGDVINDSVVYASLLAAKGYIVRLVTGHAAFKKGDQTYEGFHQWVEAAKDGKFYFVDVLDGPPAKLEPLDEARAARQLQVNRTCVRLADGATDPFIELDDKNQAAPLPPR